MWDEGRSADNLSTMRFHAGAHAPRGGAAAAGGAHAASGHQQDPRHQGSHRPEVAGRLPGSCAERQGATRRGIPDAAAAGPGLLANCQTWRAMHECFVYGGYRLLTQDLQYMRRKVYSISGASLQCAGGRACSLHFCSYYQASARIHWAHGRQLPPEDSKRFKSIRTARLDVTTSSTSGLHCLPTCEPAKCPAVVSRPRRDREIYWCGFVQYSCFSAERSW